MENGEKSLKASARSGGSGLHLLAVLVLVAISVLQRVGQTTFDTKLDLTTDPGRALGRSLTLWGTQVDFGGIANQGYGYLFPQGTFFLLGDLAHVPDWVVQRGWSALVLLLAYDGARRLARALDVGAAVIPAVVGLVYALSPRIVGLSGALTGEILPSAILPWVCLPLVLALRGRMSARRAGLLAGLAVVAMGGVNAAENLVTFPLPLFLVLSGLRGPGGRRLAAWWAGSTLAACLWWMLPLVLLGKYSPPFLDYIETAATTTRTAGWSTTIRGAEHWLGYIVVGPGQWWRGAHAMSTAPVLVVLGGLIAAIGLLGLTRRTAPYRAAFLGSLVVGLVAATAGHGGPAGTPVAGSVRDLLDGPLAPFRNVHKVDPLVRLPLAIGFGVACAALAVAAEQRRRAEAAVSARARVGGLVAIALVLASAAPAFANTLRQPGWDDIPTYWRQAATWLDHDGPGTTLVLPSTGIGQQSWGWTVDEPIQGLVKSGWVARTQIPLVPPTTIRFLDGIEDRLADGSGSAALAPTLAAAGVTRVLVRNDVDVVDADVADPQRVAAALANSPGITEVTSFGAGLGGGLPEIQVYRVAGATGTPRAVDSADLPLLTGAPEDVITAREAGVIPPDGQVRVGLASKVSAPDIVTDGYRRVERTFGRFHDAVSAVLSRTEPHRTTRKVVDFAGVTGVPRTYAAYGDVASVTATSSAGYADSLGAIRPELGPGSVLDGDLGTYWRSGPFEKAVGQRLTLTLTRARTLGRVTVETATDAAAGVPITKVRIATDHASRDVTVTGGEALADFTGAAATTHLTVTVLAVDATKRDAAVAVREISLAGLDTARRLHVPDVGAGSQTSFVFATDPPQRACTGGPLGRTCSATSARPGVEQESLDREFTVHGNGSWEVHGQAVALPTDASARSLEPLGDALSATTTSVLGGDPAVSGMYAVDGRNETPWLAATDDLSPQITLTWNKPRTISRLDLVDSVVPALTPYRARIVAGRQVRDVAIGAGGLGFFAPLRASSATITLYAHAGIEGGPTSVGVGELRLTGLGGLAKPVAEKASFTSECGLGPSVTVDGRSYPTTITGTLGDIVEGRPMDWKVCGPPVVFTSGEQELRVAATGEFSATTVALVPSGSSVTAVGTRTITASTALKPTMDVRVAPGEEAVLLFGQNANAGWRATLDGHRLESQVVDGWQQGFVVPAGAGGTVRISFAPGSEYAAALGTGAAGIVALLVLLLLDLRRPAPALVLPDRVPARRRRRLALEVAGLLVLAVLGGPVAAGAALLGALLLRRTGPVRVGAVGAVLVLASAVAAALAHGTRYGAPGGVADVLAALGCGLVIGTLALREEP